jgi:hypothetical protein
MGGRLVMHDMFTDSVDLSEMSTEADVNDRQDIKGLFHIPCDRGSSKDEQLLPMVPNNSKGGLLA